MAHIVVFDSGIGGLTVLKELMTLMPNEHYTYIADQKNLPYGNKSEQELKGIVGQIIQEHVPMDADVLVIACNTATAVMHKELNSRLPFPVVGTAKAGSQEAAERVEEGKIGIIATKQTIDNHLYTRHIQKSARFHQKNITPVGIPCPELANAIEWITENEEEKEKKKRALKNLLYSYLSPYAEELNGLIFGCTHYPLIESHLVELAKENEWTHFQTIPLVNPAKLMAKEVEDLVKNRQTETEKGDIRLVVTKDEQDFIKKANEWFSPLFVEKLTEGFFKNEVMK